MEYEKFILSLLTSLAVKKQNKGYYVIADEVEEVYAKARAFDEIVIETTGAIMNCPPGVVETEAGKLTLDIIDKYEKTNGGQINDI